MAVETTELISFISWVRVSNVGVVGHDEGVASLISNFVLNVWSIVDFWNWWEALLFQVTLIGLLGDKTLDLGSNFLTQLNSFCINFLW